MLMPMPMLGAPRVGLGTSFSPDILLSALRASLLAGYGSFARGNHVAHAARAILRVSCAQLGFVAGCVLLIEAQGDTLSSRSVSAWRQRTKLAWASSDNVRTVLRAGASPLADAYLLTRAVLSEHLAPLCAPGRGSVPSRTNNAPVAVLPLVTAQEKIGALVLVPPKACQLRESDLAALDLWARHAALAIESAFLRDQLRKRERQIRRLVATVVDVQEEERERIRLDLHDSAAQTLAPAFQHLQALEVHSGVGETARLEIRQACGLIRKALHDARDVAASLRPRELDTIGLVPTLRHELHELEQQTGQEIRLDAEPLHLSREVETTLYRVVHEAIANATTHGHARSIRVRIVREQEQFCVEVQDDGIGFEATRPFRSSSGGGIGFLSMKRRAETLGGTIAVTSNPGRGTFVKVTVPAALE